MNKNFNVYIGGAAAPAQTVKHWTCLPNITVDQSLIFVQHFYTTQKQASKPPESI